MSSMMTSRKVISANMMNNANDDLSLVSQAAVFHDRQAFGKLVVRYQSPIRRFFLHLTAGDASLSDDLAQDTFVKAFLNIERFRGASAFSTWLYRIAYNVFFDYTRRQTMTSLRLKPWSTDPPTPTTTRAWMSTTPCVGLAKRSARALRSSLSTAIHWKI